MHVVPMTGERTNLFATERQREAALAAFAALLAVAFLLLLAADEARAVSGVL